MSLLLLSFIVMTWTAAEASIWWLAPDVAIAIGFVYFPKAWRLFLTLALLGVCIGSVATYWWAQHFPDAWLHYVKGMRFHHEQNIQYVRLAVANDTFSIVKGAWSGIPYKLFIGLAGIQTLSFLPLLLIGLISRFIRFAFVLLVAAGIRKILKPWSIKHPNQLSLLLLAIWFTMIAVFDLWINTAFLAA